MNELDKRTKDYFDDIKKNLGFMGKNAGEYGIEEILEKHNGLDKANLQHVHSYEGYVNSSLIDIYKYNNREGEIRYCAELTYQTDIDDYCTETHIFNRLPSREDVVVIRRVDDIGFKLTFRRLEAEFSCWECGRIVHWLDSEGDFTKKADRLEDRYCGC